MSLSLAFAALADPTRRDLLERLATGEKTLSDLASPLPMSLMAVQKHVRVLEEAELVMTEKIGRSRHVHLRREGLHHVADWVANAETRWTESLDRLAELLDEEESA